MLPTVMHLLCGIVICAGLLKLARPLSAFAFAFAWIFHGTYDWLRTPQTAAGLLIAGFVVGAVLVRRARMIDARQKRLGGQGAGSMVLPE